VKYVVNDQVVLSQVPEGPFAGYLGPFAESLRRQGYARATICRQVMLAACFSQWLERRGVQPRRIVSDHLERYWRSRYRRCRPIQGDRAALSHFVEFLRCERVIPPEKISRRRVTPVEQCVQAYERYLREERRLAEATITNYVPFIRRFLQLRFGLRPVKLPALCARDVLQFVQRQARILHPKRAKLLTTALRSFLRYACYHGDIRLDLATVVPCVANWSMPSIPRGIAASQVRRLLSRFDRSTAVGRRDYAILLHLKARVLTIRGAKFGKDRLVPLHASTCKVPAEYIARRHRHWSGRPVSSYLFVSSSGNRLDAGQIYRVFHTVSRRIGLRGPSDRQGPRLHDLRQNAESRKMPSDAR
jgi:integrase/recombinase XerD